MALDNAWNVYIFRDGKMSLRGSDLVDGLVEGLNKLSASPHQSTRTILVDLLLRAGELECALADAASPQSSLAANITDELATALVTNHSFAAAELARRVSVIVTPDKVNVAPPEGFAYYALHPLDFVEAIKRAETTGKFAAVVGIRSIGATLSAVVQAALRTKGVHAERITVRPSGHPYDRATRFSFDQLQWIAYMRSLGADFIVADEGPGMSGSSFLSVGEALLSAGVHRTMISFLCSRDPDPSSLTALNAASRWPSFRSYCTQPTQFLPKDAKFYVAGGIWRADVFAGEAEWPASWLQMERLKFLSSDRKIMYGFEGFGRFGEDVRKRAVAVAKAGFGPMPYEREEGFGVYPMLSGRTLCTSDACPEVLQRLAEYCAFRAEHMTVEVKHNPELETMLRFNAKQEFGVEVLPHASELPIRKPVIADGRMLPHKWIECGGVLLKIDSATHGDNHFFPGPTDIAWDLAGTIVEWELDSNSSRLFLDAYQRASGDDVTGRLPAYLLAYSVFRMAYCKMAAASMEGAEEEQRLVRDYLRYRNRALMLIRDGRQVFDHQPELQTLAASL